MTSGYGKSQYGLSPYGSIDTTPPRVSSVNSLDGYTVEILFSEEMLPNAAFLDAASYTFTPTLGAACTTISVAIGTTGPNGAPTSAIITHSGTTYGGTYTLDIVGTVVDLNNTPLDVSTAVFLSRGEAATFIVNPQSSGEEIILQFDQDMVPEGTFPGIEDVNSYNFTTTFPIDLTIDAITHPNAGDFSQVLLEVSSMTSANYTLEISDATAITYDGSILPSSSTQFDGSDYGTGTSLLVPQGLSLSKDQTDVYGWRFEDLTSKITTSSTFQIDWHVDNSSASIINHAVPLGLQYFERFNFYDGTLAIDVYLVLRDNAPAIRIESGTYIREVSYDWQTSGFKLSILRNQIASLFAVAIDDAPIVSDDLALLNGTLTPLSNPGVGISLEGDFEVSGALLNSSLTTSSDTIFSNAWNFSHNTTQNFIGIPGPSVQTFPTEKGPLTKGWGDATPAGPEDVAVYLNGIRQAVSEVNPYIGEITLTIPIPLFPPGAHTVEVDYKWFETPIFELSGLNTPGLVLNQWNRSQMSHLPFLPGSGLGAQSDSRFTYSVVLGPKDPEEPLLVGHRFIAEDTSYTSSLNSPTSLLLNQDPHRVSIPGFEFTPEGENLTYEGDSTPVDATDPWVLSGVDSGSLEESFQVYQLIDSSAGTFGNGTAALYSRTVDVSFPNDTIVSVRFQGVDYTADGVFTGLCFGMHDNRRLYLVGLLDINGVKHLGMLKNSYAPQERNSWFLAGEISAEIQSQTTLSLNSEDWPKLIESGTRFQIFDSNQAGTYTIESYEQDSFGKTNITIASPGFPYDPESFGSKDVNIVLEVPWDEALSTYRLRVDPDESRSSLYFSGSLAGDLLELTKSASYALPTETNLILDTEQEGQVFWGSVSREATNTSRWTFVRYSVTPDMTTFNKRGIIVSSEMNVTPENDPNSEWDIQQDFGEAFIDSSGDNLAIIKGAGSESVDYSYHYRRVEPAFDSIKFSDTDFTFHVEYQRSGYDSASVVINDKLRTICMGTLLYTESGGERMLIDFPYSSMSGLQSPLDQGWEEFLPFEIDSSNVQRNLILSQESGKTGYYVSELDNGSESGLIDTGSRVYYSRFRVDSYTLGSSGYLGWFLGMDTGTAFSKRYVFIHLSPGQVHLSDTRIPNTPVASFNFDWDDSNFHDYRVVVDVLGNNVELYVDDTILGNVDHTSFGFSSEDEDISFGFVQTDVTTDITLGSFSGHFLGKDFYKRTLGIWLGGDKSDIDNWKIPRTDSTDLPNSDTSTTVEEMDWRNPSEVRLHRDPNWGVVLLRPDLPNPPWYNEDFATEITQPNRGWINVEYFRLPLQKSIFGFIGFGASEKRDVSVQRWDYLRYRLYTTPDQDFIAPQNMVLNRINVVNSGEALTDKTVESVVIISEDKNTVSMLASNIYASRIFKLVVNNEVLPFDSWEFDYPSQIITLNTDLPSDKTYVTVMFSPDKERVTKTYLESQSLYESTTLLNEDTPSFYADKDSDAERIVRSGSVLNDPNEKLNTPDFILNNQLNFVDFENPDTAWFTCLDIFTLDNGGATGLIAPMCETTDTGAASYHDLELDGDDLEEFLTPIKNPVSGGLGYGCFMLSGGSVEASIIPPDPEAHDVLCSGKVSGDPNAVPLDIPVTITLIDGTIVTTIYLY